MSGGVAELQVEELQVEEWVSGGVGELKETHSQRIGLFSPLYVTDQIPVAVWIRVWLPSSSNCGVNSPAESAEDAELDIEVY